MKMSDPTTPFLTLEEANALMKKAKLHGSQAYEDFFSARMAQINATQPRLGDFVPTRPPFQRLFANGPSGQFALSPATSSHGQGTNHESYSFTPPYQ
ncbi:MAG: hypothetical protein ACTJG2_02515 [Candidatus Saccharimonadales bacterium]